MSQSKIAAILASIFLIVISTFSFIDRPEPVAICASETHPTHPGAFISHKGMTWDASNSYAPTIASEKSHVSNWHSDLYMYEMRFFSRIITFFHFKDNGISVQIITWHICTFAFLLIVSLCIYKLLLKNLLYSIFVVPCAISHAYVSKWMKLGLDYFFFICLAFLIYIFTVYIPRLNFRSHATRSIFMTATAFTLLLHVCSFRKNALILVPIFAFLFAVKYTSNRIKRACIVIVSSIIFPILAAYGTSTFLPVVKLNPVAPMMSSTLRIAHILRGEQEMYRDVISRIGNYTEKEHKDKLSATPGCEMCFEFGKITEEGIELYTDKWKTKTADMACAYAIQIVEFYCGGELLIGKSLIEKIYPAIKSNPDAWKPVMSIPLWLSILRLVILSLSLVLTSTLAIRFFFKKKALTTFDRPLLIAGSVAMVYAASFAIIPPTADIRYLAPSVYLAWNSLWLFLISMLVDAPYSTADGKVGQGMSPQR